LVAVAVSVLLLVIGHRVATHGTLAFQNEAQETVKATVTAVVGMDRPGGFDEIDDPPDDLFLMMQGEQLVFEAEIRSGPRKGEVVTATQSFSGLMYAASKEVAAGDSVLLLTSGGDGSDNSKLGGEWFFNGHYRTGRLLWLGILLALGVLVFGRAKGFNTLLSIGITCAAVFAVFIPSILSGMNIYLMAILLCLYTTFATFLIVIGFNKKSLAAAIGCLGGIAATGIIVVVMDKVLFLTGMVDDHSRFLVNLPVNGIVNLRAIVFAGIIIGAMGAIMDVAMSISSPLWEIWESAPGIRFETLLKSGLNIGRDVFGTMANTLILAYIGASLSVILILIFYTDSLAGLMNMEMIVVEILQALAGSLGILLAMPLTSLCCAAIFPRGNRQGETATKP